MNLFHHIPEYFRSGELAMNDYGHVNRLNIAAMKIVFSAVGTQWAYQGFSDAHVPESWSPRLRLVEETSRRTRRRSTCIRLRPESRAD